MNKVTFHRAVDRHGETEYISARVVTPLGNEFHIGYHPHIGADGQRDGLNFGFNGIWLDGEFIDTKPGAEGWVHSLWLEDRNQDDVFCSEMFGQLTGRYPYEVEERIPGNEDYRPFPA